MNLKKIAMQFLIFSILLIAYHFLFINNQLSRQFAYVDSQKLMRDYKGMLEMNKLIEQKERTLNASLDTLSVELQNDIKLYEKQRGSMSERERKTNEELIDRKQQQYFQYKGSMEETAKNENQKIVSAELVKINSMIADFGRLNNYTIIFGTNNGNIVYADKSVDITDVVLEYINSNYVSRK